MDIEKKKSEEKKIVAKMLGVYCRGQRHSLEKGKLCPCCARMLAYANQRIENCPRTAEKTFCSKCPIQCYPPEKRRQMRAVMRYAGPRMLWRSPVLVLKHVLAPKPKKQEMQNMGADRAIQEDMQ